MSDFDPDDPSSGGDGFPDGNSRRDVTEWNGTYRGYVTRHGGVTEAISPEEGYLGRYDEATDTTVGRDGIPVGKGNWLMSFFRRG
jgi:hypothetical protein